MREPRITALVYIAIAILFVASAIWISTRIEQRILCAFAAVMFVYLAWDWRRLSRWNRR